MQKSAESKLETVFVCSGVKVLKFFVKLINFKILAPEHSNTQTHALSGLPNLQAY